jgi:hypothetical protein
MITTICRRTPRAISQLPRKRPIGEQTEIVSTLPDAGNKITQTSWIASGDRKKELCKLLHGVMRGGKSEGRGRMMIR